MFETKTASIRFKSRTQITKQSKQKKVWKVCPANITRRNNTKSRLWSFAQTSNFRIIQRIASFLNHQIIDIWAFVTFFFPMNHDTLTKHNRLEKHHFSKDWAEMILIPILSIHSALTLSVIHIFSFCGFQNFKNAQNSFYQILFKVKTIKVQDLVIKLQIWDTHPQERYICTRHSYYRGARGIFIACDLTGKLSETLLK